MTEPHADIKQRLSEAIWPDTVNVRVWRDLVTTPPHFVELVARGKRPFEELARIYQQKAEIYAPGPAQERAPRSGASDARLDALARVATVEAEVYAPGLRTFRHLTLQDRLLDPAEIPGWVRVTATAEGPPARRAVALPFPEDPGGRPGAVLGAVMIGQREEAIEALRYYLDWLQIHPDVEFLSSVEIPQERLSFFAPGGPVREVAIRRDCALGNLKRIATALSLYFKWPEHHSVAFVLSGWTPPYPRWQLLYKEAIVPALRRVVLEIDPRVSSAEAVRVYNEARAALGRGRDRPMSARSLELAVFIAQRRRTDEKWSELRDEWNRLHPKMRYALKADPTARRFALDCRNAWSRLTGQAWPGKAKKRSAKWHEQFALEVMARNEARRREAEEEWQ